MLGAFLAAMGGSKQISVDTNWGATSAGTSTITSATQTLTVPGANPGSITLGITATDGAVTAQYSKDGGAFTTFTDGTAVTGFVTGSTLAFRVTGAGSLGNGYSFTVTDTTAGGSIGTGSFTRT